MAGRHDRGAGFCADTRNILSCRPFTVSKETGQNGLDRRMQEKALTGIHGLDDVTSGGFQRGRLYLVEGNPGAGKTTAATQFLMEGAARGERGLYITLSETEEELRNGAASHGWELDEKFAIFELVPPESLLDDEQQQSLLYSSD